MLNFYCKRAQNGVTVIERFYNKHEKETIVRVPLLSGASMGQFAPAVPLVSDAIEALLVIGRPSRSAAVEASIAVAVTRVMS